MEEFEITVGGLFTTLFAFLFTTVPLLIYFFETRTPQTPAPNTEIPLPPPTKITGLYTYPIKSCRGIRLEKSKMLKTGLELDRQWMFVDAATKKFLTIREMAKMTLITPVYDAKSDELVVTVRPSKVLPNPPDVTIRIAAHPSEKWLKQNTELVPTIIWKTTTDGWAYPASMTAPLTELFGREVLLVRKGPEKRVLRGNGNPEIIGREEYIAYPDIMPVMVTSEASLKDLNARLEEEGEDLTLVMERFRPNIIVEGGDAWSEDIWSEVRITGAEKSESKDTLDMQVISRCLRCRVPNVDPDTAEEHPKQPWDLMMEFRRIDHGFTFKPAFGMHCIPRKEPTEISVGMTFNVTAVTTQHRYISGMK
ncbi:putative Fe-S protein [Eremomyces bilateralis CBS 781.70]|uniref:Fe-S protein n=1 Tax=Eremomyces bilateralis CBS 781.70 TaxID=1392243 RepID=A0A6G1G2E3_9PEZI|nr:putative Fe-S protein [Eremomyces bilateralis CBS 781.70]KAF1812224.1 putative Fe-S protein [Eremomyces bilateralis CBS 781.70]